MITRATVRYLIVHPESSEESPKNRSSHAHTHPLFPHALAHTRSYARTYNINSCIYIFIYMLYIIYKTQYSSWFFLCTWGRGSMALHETLHIYMSFHLREIRQALSRPCTRTWIPGSRVSGFSYRQWSIVAPWLGGGPCARKRRGAVLCLVYLFFSVFSFLFTLQRDSGGLRPELLGHSRFMCTPIASRSETRQRLPHSWDALLAGHSVSEGCPRAPIATRLILPLGNRNGSCTGSDHWNVWNNVSHRENNVLYIQLF